MDIFIVHSDESDSENAAHEIIEYIAKGGYAVKDSCDPKTLLLGANKHYNFIDNCKHLLGAIVVVTPADQGDKRENLLIKYAILVGEIGIKKAILCLQLGAPVPSGLEDIHFLKWGGSGKIELTNWLKILDSPFKLSNLEKRVLMEMHDRDNEFGYTTESYIQVLVENVTGSAIEAKGAIDSLVDKGLIDRKHIRRVTTFFIKTSGVIEVRRLRSEKKKVKEFIDQEAEFNPQEY